MKTKAICSWCGAPSGRPGVTLQKTTLASKNGSLSDTLLCGACYGEFRRVGRLLTFREWARFYRGYIARELSKAVRVLLALLSPSRHWRLIRIQYRFRAKGEKVRA